MFPNNGQDFDHHFRSVATTAKWGILGGLVVNLVLGSGVIGAVIYAIHVFSH